MKADREPLLETCEDCGEEMKQVNLEAWELSGRVVCDDCADEIFESIACERDIWT